MRNVIKEVTALVESMGMIVEKVERNNHYKFHLDTPQGRKTLIVSVTASDYRAILNNKSILKRWVS